MIDRLREENGPAALIQDPSKRARSGHHRIVRRDLRSNAREKFEVELSSIAVSRSRVSRSGATPTTSTPPTPDRDAPTRTTATPREMLRRYRQAVGRTGETRLGGTSSSGPCSEWPSFQRGPKPRPRRSPLPIECEDVRPCQFEEVQEGQFRNRDHVIRCACGRLGPLDSHDSGASPGNRVEVRVLSSAPSLGFASLRRKNGLRRAASPLAPPAGSSPLFRTGAYPSVIRRLAYQAVPAGRLCASRSLRHGGLAYC
jgi:hypothetical protein